MTGWTRAAATAAMMGCALFGGSAARAQTAEPTGFELALEGGSRLHAGRVARVRGTAYRVRGLAELTPFDGRVRARLGWSEGERRTQPWSDVSTDPRGRFVAEIPIPEGSGDGGPQLEVEVGPEGEARRFAVPVQIAPGVSAMLRTDRVLYEPGETVHVWALLRDRSSLRPLTGERAQVSVTGESLAATERTLQTDAAGVAHFTLTVPEGARAGEQRVTLTVPGQLEAHGRFSVGTRTYERLFARLTIAPEPVAPGAEVEVRLEVTGQSGAPVRDANAIVTVDGDQQFTATTDDAGEARVRARAPVYLEGDRARVPVEVELSHPAHGSMELVGAMRLAVPLALDVEVQPRHGALVPEVDDVVFVHVRDVMGEPPPAGTAVSARGPAFAGGRAEGTTDANGLVSLPVRLPRGAAARRSGETLTTAIVRVAGALERTARVDLPVAREADVAPTPATSILAPGDAIEVTLARRPRAAGAPVVLELIAAYGRRLATTWLDGRAGAGRLTAPADFVGVARVCARAVRDDDSHEGPATCASVILRPPAPDFVRVEPTQERWTVGETARVRLHTGAGGPARYAAVLVRDLAAHGGEHPFRARLMEELERALRAPTDEVGRRFADAAMAAVTAPGAAPVEVPPLVDDLGLPTSATPAGTRRSLRDPWPLRAELLRRGVAEPMSELEGRLSRAVTAGALDELTEVRAGARRFREDALPPDARTLGDGRLTPSMLEAADPSFTYDRVATRVARARLVGLLVRLAAYLDPGDDAPPAARMAAREPYERWLPRMVERGLLGPRDLDDPWGHRFELRATRQPALRLSARAAGVELASPGPDGRFGTQDDVRDPFARAVPAGTPYAVASGEDALMRRLARTSAAEATLRMIGEAYARVSAEMTEEEIGDAVSAEVSEGTLLLGSLSGTGRGGGGVGHGYGHGGLGVRGARAATVRGGRGPSGLRGIAAVVRERFPPTLLFAPSVTLDPSGVTEIAVPLADAVTTYAVEAIVWREDGWMWSGDARLSVEREIVVEAPIPEVARRGDALRLPLRVSNHGDAPRELVISLAGDEGLGVASSEPVTVTVPANDAVVVPVSVRPARAGEGELTVIARGPDGAAVDAVRRPMRVLEGARRVAVERLALASGRGALALTVPDGAHALDATVTIAAGGALFGEHGEPDAPWESWGARERGLGPTTAHTLVTARMSPQALGFAIGRAWGGEHVDDAALTDATTWLTRRLSALAREPEGHLAEERAWALLGLAPAAQAASARRVADLPELIERLREEVADEALARSDDPALAAISAAALAWTSGTDEGASRDQAAAELARRLARHAVDVGDDRWLGVGSSPVQSTLLLALVELGLDQRPAGFRALATVARWTARGHALSPFERGLAQAAVERLGTGTPPEATVRIDGARHIVTLEGGAGLLHVRELATPGTHRVEVIAAGAPLLARAEARFGVPWDRPPPERGPFTLAIAGDPGGLDETAALELTVHNRAPRTIAQPVVEIELPTGAELTAAAEREMGVQVTRAPGLLRLRLPPMRPGSERTLPLPLRWSVAGALVGLGVSASAPDRPAAVSVLPPREVTIDEVTIDEVTIEEVSR